MRLLKFFLIIVVISRKTVKWAQNNICDTCALNSQRNEIFEILPHTIGISPKTVKWDENTNCDTCALNSRRYEIFEVFPHTVWSKTSKVSYLREFSAQVSQIVFWVHLTVLRLITTVISRKTVKWTQNTICDTCALNSRRYEIFEVLLHTVVGSRKMVKLAEYTICDTWALNSRRYKIFEVLPHTLVISRKTVKWAQNTICHTCAVNLLRYKTIWSFSSYSYNKPEKQSNELRTRFVILVHLTHGDIWFLKFYLIQLE